MRCPNCGNENPPDYMFCDECGARLGSDTEQAATTSPDAAAAPATPAIPGEGPESFPASTAAPGVQPYVSPGYSSTSSSNEDTSGAQPAAPDAEPYGMPTATEGEAAAPAVPEGPDFDLSLSDVDEEAAAALPPTDDTLAAPSWDTGVAAGEAAMPDVVPVDTEAPALDSAAAAEAAEEVEPATAVPDYGTAPAAEGSAAAATSAEYSPPGVYIEEVSSGARPIEGVGTSTAGMVGTAPEGGLGAAAAGGTWAADALHQLDAAQASLASGDWAAFATGMSTLRTTLQAAAEGTGAGAAEAVSSMAGATQAPAPYMDTTAPAAEPTPAPTLEPAAEAGTLEAAPDSGVDMGAAAAGAGAAAVADTTSSGPMAGAGAGMARLVVISTGAELSLPEQEEITVGREDPSSGIFPDVDLTPYGGEDGGVSRRHARLMHIGGDYFVEDLQSTNYTKLDGQRLPAHVRERLEDGARLDFGRVAVIFRRN
jgi:hypothetical protein